MSRVVKSAIISKESGQVAKKVDLFFTIFVLLHEEQSLHIFNLVPNFDL